MSYLWHGGQDLLLDIVDPLLLRELETLLEMGLAHNQNTSSTMRDTNIEWDYSMFHCSKLLLLRQWIHVDVQLPNRLLAQIFAVLAQRGRQLYTDTQHPDSRWSPSQ